MALPNLRAAAMRCGWNLSRHTERAYYLCAYYFAAHGTRSVPTLVAAHGACLLPCHGTRSVPTTFLKPRPSVYRIIRSIIALILAVFRFFGGKPQKPAVRVKFFTKKGLTDILICCIIGRLYFYRGEIMSTFRRSRPPNAQPRKLNHSPRHTPSHERIPIFMIQEKDASPPCDERHNRSKKISNVNLSTQKKTGGKLIMGNQGMTNWKFTCVPYHRVDAGCGTIQQHRYGSSQRWSGNNGNYHHNNPYCWGL